MLNENLVVLLKPSIHVNVSVSRQVYWAGPMLGGIVATIIYAWFVDRIGRREPSLSQKPHE